MKVYNESLVESLTQDTEEKAIKFSMIMLLVFALLGITFGTLLKSEVILFDGVYSIVNLMTSYIVLRIVRFIGKKNSKKFPFGKEGIEPFVLFIQYLLLNLLLLYMFVDGIQIILNGGNELNLGFTIVYLIMTTILQFFLVKRLAAIAKNSRSVIVKAEVFQWQLSLKQSLYVLIGYLIGIVFLLLNEQGILSFIDPIILLVFIIVTCTQTIEEMILAFKELIGMSTIGREAYNHIEKNVRHVKNLYEITDYYIRVKKVGGMLVLEIDFLVEKDFQYGSIAEQDKIREDIFNMVNEKHLNLWLSISFTSQLRWIE